MGSARAGRLARPDPQPGRLLRDGTAPGAAPAARRVLAALLVPLLALTLAGCANRPQLIRDLTALPVDATNVKVTLLDSPDFEVIDWWEVHYTTAHPKETVATIRDYLIHMVDGAVDDANEGYGFTIGKDLVDVHEVYTTDAATTTILVRVRKSIVDGVRAIDG